MSSHTSRGLPALSRIAALAAFASPFLFVADDAHAQTPRFQFQTGTIGVTIPGGLAINAPPLYQFAPGGTYTQLPPLDLSGVYSVPNSDPIRYNSRLAALATSNRVGFFGAANAESDLSFRRVGYAVAQNQVPANANFSITEMLPGMSNGRLRITIESSVPPLGSGAFNFGIVGGTIRSAGNVIASFGANGNLNQQTLVRDIPYTGQLIELRDFRVQIAANAVGNATCSVSIEYYRVVASPDAPGCGGQLSMSYGTTSVVNNSIVEEHDVTVSGAAPGGLVALALSATNARSPLPLPDTSCDLIQTSDPLTNMPPVDASGRSTLRIPVDSTIVGTFFLQAVHSDPATGILQTTDSLRVDAP